MIHKNGILVALEGIDGSGKTSLAHFLHKKLSEENISTLLTREPGGTPLGKNIRHWLHESTEPLTRKAEFLLFAADRAQHIHDVIVPALQQRTVIISDRFSDSSVVYQGYGKHMSIDLINLINQWVMEDVRPDITLYLHLSRTISQERIYQRGQQLSPFENQGNHFTDRLIEGFETMYKNRTDVITIDATQPFQTVAECAYHHLTQYIQKTWKKTYYEDPHTTDTPACR